MRLNVNEAAELLDTPAGTIYRWIESGDLPAYRVNEQFRINRIELLEWATLRNIAVGPALFHDDETAAAELGAALAGGGLMAGLEGATRAEIAHHVVRRLDLPAKDGAMLEHLLVARDKAAFVTIPGGAAIPHVRHPIVLSAEPRLYVFFLAAPIEFTAAPVHCLFVLLTPTIRTHLQLVAKLAYLLRDDRVTEAIRTRDAQLARLITQIESEVA